MLQVARGMAVALTSVLRDMPVQFLLRHTCFHA